MPSVRADGSGWIYIIGPPEAGFVKIGTSRQPGQRLSALQSCARSRRSNTIMPRSIDPSVLMVLYQQPGGRPVEKELHAHFATSWVMGEWYALGSSAVARVRSAIADLHLRGRIDVGPPPQSAVRPRNSDVVYLLGAAGPAHQLGSGRQWRTRRTRCGESLAGARSATFAGAFAYSIPICERCFPGFQAKPGLLA